MSAAIIIMCKTPIAGAVKTRLTPFLSAEQAAELAVCFAQDTVAKAQVVCPNVIVAYTPDNGKYLLERILSENLLWSAQKGNDLGERMHNAFVFNKNYTPLVMIGTDSPNLPPRYIEQAFAALSENRADVVLGETEDGGYYLVGVNKPDARIFADVEWSSPRTFEKTAKNIENLDLKLEILPVWYDVDLPEDLQRLREDILTSENSAHIVPRTTKWLRNNENLFQPLLNNS